jgi:hypothetical protein
MNTLDSNMQATGPRWATLRALIIASALAFTTAMAAEEQRGTYTLDYGAMLQSQDRQEAEEKALQNAIERWVAEKNPSHYDNYKRVSQTINGRIRDYLLDYVTEADQDRSSKTYRVIARVTINEPKLMDELLSASEAVSPAGDEYITFMFVARQQIGQENRSASEASITKEQTETLERARAENEAGQTRAQQQTIRKEEANATFNAEPIWDVATTQEVDAAMGRVFSETGYLVIDAGLLEAETGDKLKIARFVEDYRHGNDLSSETRRDAISGLRDMEDPVRYFALGTLDVDAPVVDSQTGNIKIAVAITGQVLDIDRRGAVVAKTGPETMFGEGPTELVARNNALKLAAEQVAKQLVAQLSSRDIR